MSAGTGGGAGGGTSTGGGSATGGGGSAASDGGVDAGVAVPTPSYHAYRLSVGAVALPSTCFRPGADPGNASTSPMTIDVLTWDVDAERFLALPSRVITVGHAPAVALPEATSIGVGELAFATTSNEQRHVGGYTEARQRTVRVTFDSLGAMTTGTLQLDATYACIAGTSPCPMPLTASDSASCTVTLPFTASTIAVAPSWFEPATAVPGATRLLTVWNEGSLKTVAPTCLNAALVHDGPIVTEVAVRRRRVLQVVGDELSLDGLIVQLGDAPTIHPGTLRGAPGAWGWLNNAPSPMAGYTEYRQTQATVELNGSAGVAAFDARYACVRDSADCPTGAALPADATSCQASAHFVATAAP